MKGVTESGFKFNISDKALKNMELLEVMAEVDSNRLLLPKLLSMLLGDDQKKQLYDHVRDDEGYVDTDKITEEVLGMIHILNEGAEKN
jgi:hypothetical protein